MLKKYRTFKVLSVVLVLLALYAGGRLLVFQQVKKVMQQQLAQLEKQGIEINVEALRVGPWQNKVQLDRVRIKFTEGYGTDNKVQASLGTITLRGIALLRAVWQKELWIHSVQLSRPDIQSMVKSEQATPPDKKVKNPRQPAIRKFFIKDLHIYKGSWKINENTDTPVRVATLDEIQLTDIRLENKSKGPLQWQVGKTRATAVRISVPKAMHTYSVQAIAYDAKAKTLLIDTLKIIPDYNRSEFAQKAGREYPRLSGVLPYIRITGCELESNPQFTFRAKEIRTKLWLESYLDKRPPFKDPATRVLPVEFLRRLSLVAQVDTIRLEDSYAQHEEFPEIGETTGKVFFSKINATLAHLSTQKPKNENTLPTLSATALLMGTGDLRAEFGFPANPNGTYFAKGALYRFPMTRLNLATESLAKAKVESGTLKSLHFNFTYNNDRSDGQVEMNYNDFKVTLFKKDNPNKKAGLVNFLVNNFVIKEDLDETMDKEKRTGIIQVYRDRRRGLFYFWWKSVLSGVLSTYNISKVPEPKDISRAEQRKISEERRKNLTN
jgi:hypothetical protein